MTGSPPPPVRSYFDSKALLERGLLLVPLVLGGCAAAPAAPPSANQAGAEVAQAGAGPARSQDAPGPSGPASVPLMAPAQPAPGAEPAREPGTARVPTGEPDGAPDSSASGEADRPGPRLWSQEYQTWIWARPKVGGRFLGTIRVGQSVALRSTERVPGEGCSKGFFEIEPRGYVCLDRTVTLDPDTPFLGAVRETLPREGPFPYDYALSNGAPMYARIPTEAEQKRNEWRYGKAGEWAPFGMFQRGHEELAVADPIEPRDPIPEFLRDGGAARGVALQLFRRSIPHGSMFSYTRAFDVAGRTFLLSADLTVVPANRVRAFRRSAFRGTAIGGGVQLPLAWFRTGAGHAYSRSPSGEWSTRSETWPIRTFVALTGRRLTEGATTFWEVREPDRPAGSAGPRGREPVRRYVDEREATVVEAESERPFGIEQGAKWILVSISNGTLVAYEDRKPVYATLVSPGQGGVPVRGRDHVKYSTTPLGAFRITYKDRAATMSPEKGEDRSFWIADVPNTQYFNPPFALHAAYWHESFGQPMSAGCVNASPLDAEWLFQWTEPVVPPGWQGATGAAAPENGRATWVVVRR